MKTFVYSDPHFGHDAIIKYESRPFDNVNHMDKELIDNWNEHVGKNDLVYVLGDFSFYNLAKTEEIVRSLNGRKRLLLGNHDRGHSLTWWKKAGFEEAYEHPICYGGFYWFSHEPMYVNSHMPYVNVHGHIHGQKYESEQYVNVSVEHTEYKPVLFEIISARFQKEHENETF